MRVCPQCLSVYDEEAAYCPEDGTELRRSEDRYLGRTIASRYRLIKRLGSGGMSVVYLARHVIIDRLSAIKILRADLGSSPAYRERFLREAKAVNRINHRNIVEISDVGESDGVAYLVMEYISGESLLAHIQKGVFPWPRAAYVAAQIASALGRAHQLGVIHRDLKPENVILVPDESTEAERHERTGDWGTLRGDARELVKLTDFGIAKIVDLPAITFTEQLFGTPGYIAPEYVEGQDAGAAADIYSLGVVLYEMVTGALPFEGKGQADLLLKPLTTDPTPPTKHTPSLPQELEGLILRMLARHPEDRPADAFVVHDALAELSRRYGSVFPEDADSVGRMTGAQRDAMATVMDADALFEQEPATRSFSRELRPPSALPAAPPRESIPPPLQAAAAPETVMRSPGSDLPPASEDATRIVALGIPPSLSSTPDVGNPIPAAAFPEARPRLSAPPPRASAFPARLSWVPPAEHTAEGWEESLRELEASIDRVRHRGAVPEADTSRAASLAESARGMVPRVERASNTVADLQLRVDELQARAREFRASLGKAIDVLLRDRSRERVRIDGLRARRNIVAVRIPTSTDGALWEAASLAAEEERARAVDADLSFQIESLQRELDRRNEDLDRELLDATGQLEGALSAFRALTNELLRALEAAATLVSASHTRRPRPVV